MRRRLTSPLVQILAALCGMVGGAWLIGLWMVGVVIMVGSLLVAVDALSRDWAPRRRAGRVEGVLERYWRAR